MTQQYHLAQINIAKMLAPIDHPLMADFVANLDAINSMAERSPGFVWRLKGVDNNATAIKIFDDDFLIINMSVWETKEALFDFTYRSDHSGILKRKKQWFSPMGESHMAFWYMISGREPSPEEAKKRLAYLNQYGQTPYAFTFKSNFGPLDAIKYDMKTDGKV
jgi:hypothetical protein